VRVGKEKCSQLPNSALCWKKARLLMEEFLLSEAYSSRELLLFNKEKHGK
jgi:hypothetical protein